jgi:phage terminase Nu1 subunit (DNA packaging protein)
MSDAWREYVNAADVAELLGLTVADVRRFEADGLKVYQFGRGAKFYRLPHTVRWYCQRLRGEGKGS